MRAALRAAEDPLPPACGALGRMVSKRPAGNSSCITKASPSFGELRFQTYTAKSYITRYDKASNKWPLVVEVTEAHPHKRSTVFIGRCWQACRLRFFLEVTDPSTHDAYVNVRPEGPNKDVDHPALAWHLFEFAVGAKKVTKGQVCRGLALNMN